MYRRTLLRWIAGLASVWPFAPLRLFAQSVALSEADTVTIGAIAEAVLPSAVTAEERRAAVTRFTAWVANYRESAEMGAGYGTTRLRSTGPSPAARYPAQLAALESAARATGAKSLGDVPMAGRRTIIEAALNTPQRVTQLPGQPNGANLVADFMGFFFNSGAGYNLAYAAAINRDDCRTLEGSEKPPAPLAPSAKVAD